MGLSLKATKRMNLLGRMAAGSGVFLGAFMVTLLASSIFTPIQPSNAGTAQAVIRATGYFIDISSAATLTMDINATPTGKISSTKDTVNVKSNVPNGYKLYLSMEDSTSGGNKLYLNGDNTSASFMNPTSGTFAAPAALDMNSWGYALANDATGAPTNTFDAAYAVPNPADSSKWAAVPLQGQEQLIQTVTNADETNGINTDIYYAAKANTSLAAGVYSNVIVYTAISDASGTNDIATVSPSVTEKIYGGETITITTSMSTAETDFGEIIVKIGDKDCANPVGSSATGTLVVTCTSPAMSTGYYPVSMGVSKFNKVWTIADGIEYKFVLSNLEAVAYMQNMTTEICGSIPTPSASVVDVPSATLIDTRDNKQYKVAKLADGNCWMIDNLRLGTNGVEYQLTPDDSDVSPSGFTLPSAQVQTGVNWNVNNSVHVYDTNNVANGNYYNWYTATAGTGNSAMAGTDAPYSVCPKGWKLPSYTGSDSFQNLVNVYGATTFAKIQAAPLSFVPAGYYYYSNGSIGNVGATGNYWSASATATAATAYDLTFYSSGVNPQYSNTKLDGFSVRCVAR